MTVSLRTDRRLLRAHARSVRHVLASYVAPSAPARAGRLPVNVALVLDRSGSMAGERKFALARRAVEEALRMLRPEDRFALVVFDDRVDVVARSAPATAEAKARALLALAEVDARGSTDLAGGWLRGCEEVARHLDAEGIARALLLTDGLANQGITDRGVLAQHAAELRRRGIATSTFGVGDDFDERLLRDLAHEGGGNFYFIESPAQIPDLLTSELGEALEVTVRRAVLTLELPAGAEAEVLNRFRSERGAGGVTRVELGDLASGQEVTVAVRVRFARGTVGATTAVRAALGADEALTPHEWATLPWTYATHADNDAQPRDRVVDRAVARLYAARARAEATESNRDGDLAGARRVLLRTARRMAEYAGDDAELQAVVAELDAAVPSFATPMAPRALKAALFQAEVSGRGREPDGKARRRPPA